MGARRNLIIRGTRKIYYPTIAHVGMFLAFRTSDTVFRRYHDAFCERFWRGELEIDTETIRQLVLEAGAEVSAFDESIASGEGARQCRAIAADAEQRGVFGVPTFLLQETGELFWGTDRVWPDRAGEIADRAAPLESRARQGGCAQIRPVAAR